MKKKTIVASVSGFVLGIALIIGLVCYFEIPRFSYSYDEELDGYLVSHVYGNAKEMTVPQTYRGKPVKGIATRGFYQKEQLETLHFAASEQIVYIGRLAFSGCKKLKRIDLSMVHVIERNAFEDCISLESVHLRVPYLRASTFYGCTSLKEVVLEDTIRIGSYAFAETAICTLILPSTCEKVDIDAFYYACCLEKIVVTSPKLKDNDYLLSLGICEFAF